MAATATGTPAAAEQAPRDADVTALGLAFRHVFRTLNRMRGRDTHLAGTDLSHAQFELLLELSERGGLSAGELAAAARLSPGTVTEMLDLLAESGHVERTRSETDRRVVVSQLTPLGAAKIEAKRELWAERWAEALEGFAPRELRAATLVLERLGQMFEQGPSAEGGEEASEPPSNAAKTGRKPGQ